MVHSRAHSVKQVRVRAEVGGAGRVVGVCRQ